MAPQGSVVTLGEPVAAPSSQFPGSHKGRGCNFYTLGDEMRQDHVQMEKPLKYFGGGGVMCSGRNPSGGHHWHFCQNQKHAFSDLTKHSARERQNGLRADESKPLLF